MGVPSLGSDVGGIPSPERAVRAGTAGTGDTEVAGDTEGTAVTGITEATGDAEGTGDGGDGVAGGGENGGDE